MLLASNKIFGKLIKQSNRISVTIKQGKVIEIRKNKLAFRITTFAGILSQKFLRLCFFYIGITSCLWEFIHKIILHVRYIKFFIDHQQKRWGTNKEN